MGFLDFWQFKYSQRIDLQDAIAEYIVAKTLETDEPYNSDYWTFFDILYRNKRIEVKETSYYYAWQSDNEPKCPTRIFSISKAYSEYKNSNSSYERKNDIYVFYLNTGYTKEESDSLVLEHWQFFVIPTNTINKECKDAKP